MNSGSGRQFRIGAALACATLCGTIAAHATTYYVDVNYDGANGASDGTESRPWTRLGDAITAYTTTPYGHTVLVANGEYKSTAAGGTETFGTTGYNLLGRKGDWKGGYVGQVGGATMDWTEPSRTLPDADAISTATMTVVNLTDANSRAFTSSGADHVLVFDGFVFRDSDVSQASYNGGALLVNGQYAAAAVRNCVFLNNKTTGIGGGLWLRGRGGLSSGLAFVDNQAATGGGALITGENIAATLEDSLFEGNVASGHCGGLYVSSHTLNLNRVDFLDNQATLDGGGLGTYNGSGNGNNVTLNLRQCRFVGNTARNGAALGSAHYKGPTLFLENCLVAGNTATDAAGYAVLSQGADSGGNVTLRHTTVAGNTTYGGMYSHRTQGGNNPVTTVLNTIVTGSGSGPALWSSDPAPTIDYNVVRGYTTLYGGTAAAGANDSSSDPLFADEPNGDYRLAKASPCIDAATDLAVTVDLDGVERPTRTAPDRGAYEEWQIPIIANRVPVATSSGAEVRAEFTYESADIATHAWFVIDTSDQGTDDLSDWWQSADSGEQVQGGIFGQSFSGLAANTVYVYRCVASNSYDVFWGRIATFTTPASGGVTRLWVGEGGNALASNGANWQGGTAPTANDYILLDSSPSNMTWDAGVGGLPATVARWTQTENYTGTVTFNTTYASYSTAFTVFTVGGDAAVGGGAWTHIGPQNHSDQRYRLNVAVGGDLSVSPTGTITAFGKGYNNNQGPGVGAWNPGRGGSHGGQGGAQAPTRGTTYGSVREPVALGSGGTTGSSNNGHGGGSIELTVSGAARVDGVIGADAFSPAAGWQAGAGGSVWLKAASLSGAGTLSADGTQAGGGGRVAVKLDEAAAVEGVALRALGGIHDWNTGAAGTVYVETTAHDPGKGVLTLDNAGRGVAMLGGDPHLANCATRMPTAGNGGPVDLADFAEVVVAGKAILGLASDTVWNPAATPLTTVDRNTSWVGLTDAANSVVWPASFAIDGFSLVLGDALTASGNWTVAADGRITRFRARGATYSADERLVLNLTGNLAVASGGEIHTDYQGYANTFGLAPAAWSPGRGGGHGGQGGYTTAAPGLTYGSVLTPVNWGSGGSSGGNNNGDGAGAIELNVSGTLTVDGQVRALPYPNGNNGGAGGAIRIVAGDLAGSGGIIRARGFNSGGGGRVSVRLTNGTAFPGGVAIDARGGTISGWEGASGTVYTETAAQAGGAGAVLVENGHWAALRAYGAQLPPSTGAFTDDLSKATLQLRDRGRLALTADTTVGDLEVSANSYLATNGFKLYVDAIEHHLDNPSVKGTGDTAMVDTYANIVWTGVPTTTVLIVR